MSKRYTFFSVSFGLILIAVWLYFVDLHEMLGYLRGLRVAWVGVACFAYLAAYFMRSLRWRALLSPQIKLKPLKVYEIWMAGHLINYLIPVRAGELAKSIALKKTQQIPLAASLPITFIDKVFDSISIFLVLALLPFTGITFTPLLSWLIGALLAVFVFGFGVLILAGIAHEFLVRLLHRFLFFLPQKWEEKILMFIDEFVHGLSVFKHHADLILPAVIYTLSAVFLDSIFFYSIFLSFSQHINFFTVLFGYTLIYLSYALPQPPAQIGSNQLMMIIVFSGGLGLDKEMVSAVMTFSHLITGILIAACGFMSLSFIGLKMVDLSKLD